MILNSYRLMARCLDEKLNSGYIYGRNKEIFMEESGKPMAEDYTQHFLRRSLSINMNNYLIYKKLIMRLLLGAALIGIEGMGLLSVTMAQEPTTNYENPIRWQEVAPGFELASYYFQNTNAVMKSEVALVRIDPALYQFDLGLAADLGQSISSVKDMAERQGAILGINASFFDPQGKALGLLVRQKKQLQRGVQGSRILSGVFYVQNGVPHIVHRNTEIPSDAEIAVQAGPRLLSNGEPIELSSTDAYTRRSGLAVTYDGKVIIFATQLRFPGATLRQTQELVMDKRLNVQDAVNLDGGGSSQLYISKDYVPSHTELYYSGGDLIPVSLLVKPNPQH